MGTLGDGVGRGGIGVLAYDEHVIWQNAFTIRKDGLDEIHFSRECRDTVARLRLAVLESLVKDFVHEHERFWSLGPH